jgi:hypothetical protein
VSFEALKEALAKGASTHQIEYLTMLDDEDDGDIYTLKVPIIYESNMYGKGILPSKESKPERMYVTKSTIEKVTTTPYQGSQPPAKEEKTQEGEGGGESEDQRS